MQHPTYPAGKPIPRRGLFYPVPVRSSSFCHDRKRRAVKPQGGLWKTCWNSATSRDCGHRYSSFSLRGLFTSAQVVGYFSFHPLSPLSRTQVQARRKFSFFNLSDAGLKHFIISHCADPPFRIVSNVSYSYGVLVTIFTRNNIQILSRCKRRSTARVYSRLRDNPNRLDVYSRQPRRHDLAFV